MAVLVATLFLPVLQIYGTSMAPNLQDGDIVLSVKTGSFNQGDIIAFYYNNKILVKRVIAGPGQWVDIDDEGNVYVDGELLDEPYVYEKICCSSSCQRNGCAFVFVYKPPSVFPCRSGEHGHAIEHCLLDDEHQCGGKKEYIVGKAGVVPDVLVIRNGLDKSGGRLPCNSGFTVP